MKCVILCGGASKRMQANFPKTLLPLNGKPSLGWIINYWRDYGIEDFVFLTGHYHDLIEEYIVSLPVKSVVIKGEGLASVSLDLLRVEPYVNGRFVLALGDCIHKGTFEDRDFNLGIGVWKTNDLIELNKSYLVEGNDNTISRVTEKPNLAIVDYYTCGMGTYFFDNRIFEYIRQLSPFGLTDIIQVMLDANEEIVPVWFEGKYINITYPEDIEKAEEILL